MDKSEVYMVSDVRLEINSLEAKLEREDKAVSVKGKDRQNLLVKIGDSLADDFSVDNSHIWGLYNSVPLH